MSPEPGSTAPAAGPGVPSQAGQTSAPHTGPNAAPHPGPLTRLQTLVRELGTAAALAYMLHRVWSRLTAGRGGVYLYGLYAQPLAAGGAAPRPDPRWSVHLLKQPHPLASQFPRPAVSEARWHSGAECLALARDGSFVGHIWAQPRVYREDEVRCDFHMHPAPQCVWDFDVFVTPAQRHGRAFQRLWAAFCEHQTRRGVRWSMSRISLFNAASVRSHQRLGAVRCGWLLAWVTGPVQCTVWSRAPWLHLSLSDRQRPRLTVNAPENRPPRADTP